MKLAKGFSRDNLQTARCRIFGCVNQKNAPRKGKGMFLVPKDRLGEWIRLAGNADLLKLPLQFLRKNMRVCEDHFLPEQILRGPKIQRLCKPVDPSKFFEGHTPLSDEDIVAWKTTKHYGSFYAAAQQEEQRQHPTTSNYSASVFQVNGEEQEQVIIDIGGTVSEVGGKATKVDHAGLYLSAVQGVKGRMYDTLYETHVNLGRGQRRKKRKNQFPSEDEEESDDEDSESEMNNCDSKLKPWKRAAKGKRISKLPASPPPLALLQQGTSVESSVIGKTASKSSVPEARKFVKSPAQITSSKSLKVTVCKTIKASENKKRKSSSVCPKVKGNTASFLETLDEDEKMGGEKILAHSPASTVSLKSSEKESRIMSPLSPSRQPRHFSPVNKAHVSRILDFHKNKKRTSGTLRSDLDDNTGRNKSLSSEESITSSPKSTSSPQSEKAKRTHSVFKLSSQGPPGDLEKSTPREDIFSEGNSPRNDSFLMDDRSLATSRTPKKNQHSQRRKGTPKDQSPHKARKEKTPEKMNDGGCGVPVHSLQDLIKDYKSLNAKIDILAMNVERICLQVIPGEKLIKCPSDLPSFPVEDENEMRTVKAFLDNGNNLAVTAQYMSRHINPNNFQGSVRKLLKQTVSKGLARSYTFTGQKGKLSLEKTNLWSMILSALMTEFDKKMVLTAPSIAGRWLTLAAYVSKGADGNKDESHEFNASAKIKRVTSASRKRTSSRCLLRSKRVKNTSDSEGILKK